MSERQVKGARCVAHLRHCSGCASNDSHASRYSLKTPHTRAYQCLNTSLGLKHHVKHQSATRKHSAWKRDEAHAESAWERVPHIPPWEVQEHSLETETSPQPVHDGRSSPENASPLSSESATPNQPPTGPQHLPDQRQREIEHGFARLAATLGVLGKAHKHTFHCDLNLAWLPTSIGGNPPIDRDTVLTDKLSDPVALQKHGFATVAHNTQWIRTLQRTGALPYSWTSLRTNNVDGLTNSRGIWTKVDHPVRYGLNKSPMIVLTCRSPRSRHTKNEQQGS